MISSRDHRWRRLALATAVSLLALPSLAASLSLEDALNLAERQAPSLAAQSARLAAASHLAVSAGELPDPKLLLGVQNFPIGGPERGSLDDDFMTMQMVGVMQEVPNRAKRRARVEVAQAAVDRAEAERQVEALKVRRDTALAWIATYSVERKLQLFSTLYQENRLLHDAVRAQLGAGLGQAADSIAPRQEAAQLAEQEDQLMQSREVARAALRRWIGEAGNAPLAGGLPDWPIAAARYPHNLRRHPELAAYTPMQQEAAAGVRQALADKRPDWSWELDYQRRGREFGDMLSVQFSIDLPIFPGSRQDPKIAAQYAQVARLEAEREALEREYAQAQHSDLGEYARLSRAVRRSEELLLPLAEEKVTLSLAGYRAGSGALADVLAARRELIDARLRQIDLQGQRAQVGSALYFTYGESAQ